MLRSLLAMNKRDEALRATEDAMAQQSEQANNINAEMEGLRKSLQQEELKSEAQMGVLKKVEGEAELVQRNIKQMRDKRKKCAAACATACAPARPTASPPCHSPPHSSCAPRAVRGRNGLCWHASVLAGGACSVGSCSARVA